MQRVLSLCEIKIANFIVRKILGVEETENISEMRIDRPQFLIILCQLKQKPIDAHEIISSYYSILTDKGKKNINYETLCHHNSRCLAMSSARWSNPGIVDIESSSDC